MTEQPRRLVPVGRVSGVFGVKGWLRVRSATEPSERILGYLPWQVRRDGQWTSCEVEEGRPQRGGHEVMLVKLAGVPDREAAEGYVGAEIAVYRSQLPRLDEDEFYWCDLLGLEVVDHEGRTLGRVERLMETGANDVLVVRGEREHLIPFLLHQVVRDVDVARGRVVVEWNPDF